MANPLQFQWAQQAAIDDPATYNQGTARFSEDPYQVKANRQMLEQAGLWNPAWNDWAAAPEFNGEGAGWYGAQPDLSSLDGYSVNAYRGPENTRFAQLMDPNGQQLGLDQWDHAGSMKGKDWLTAAAVIGAGMGAGNLLGGAIGGGAGAGGAELLSAADAGIGSFPAGMEGFSFGNVGAGGAAGSAALDPMAAYLTSGAAEGSTLLGGLTGAGGAAGAVGAGTTAGTLGTIGNALGGLGRGLGTANGLANLASAGIGIYGQNKAIGAMRDATNQSNDLQRSMFDTIRADNQPLVDLRNGVLPQIQALLKDPNSITSQPGYQFQFGEGQKALNNGAAGRGMTYSGAQGKALQRYGQDFASTKLDQSLNRLTNVAGMGQVGSNSNNNAASNYGANVGNNLLNQGQANASMYGNRATIGGNALSDIFNPWQYDQVNRRGP